jgi:hypothetical protein
MPNALVIAAIAYGLLTFVILFSVRK